MTDKTNEQFYLRAPSKELRFAAKKKDPPTTLLIRDPLPLLEGFLLKRRRWKEDKPE